MSLNKYFMTTTFTYLVIFLTPLISAVITLSKFQLITITTIAYIIGACLLIFLATKLTEAPLIEAEKATQRSPKKIIVWGILGIFMAYFGQIFAVLIETNLFNLTAGSENTQAAMDVIQRYPLYLLAVTVGGPIMEELVFRRALIGVLTQVINPLVAASISSFAFALAHNDGHLLIYFVMGMIFYYLYKKTGSIWTSTIAHCSMNLLVVLAQMAFL